MTTIFIVSMFGLSGMIVSKVFELKVRKIEALSNFFTKGDALIHQTIDTVISKYNRWKIIVNIFVFDFLPSYLYELLVKMKDYVSKKYYEAGDQFRGRRILKSTGSVSFFLERLSEDKSKASDRQV